MVEYEMPVTFGETDFDRNGNLKAGAVQRVFQDGATGHAEECGVGHDAMMRRNQIWVVTKLRYELTGGISAGESCTLFTYPMRLMSRLCRREFFVRNALGETVLKGSSLWCVIDFTTRAAVRPEIYFEGEFRTEGAFEDDFARIKPANLTRVGEHEVAEADLDINEHTNNCRYGDLVCSVLDGKRIDALQLVFAHETRLGDVIGLYSEPFDGGCFVCGRLPDGREVFSARAVFGA